MSEITMIDGKPRRTRQCPECKQEFQILNKNSTQPTCDECHKRIKAELPGLQARHKELFAKLSEIENLANGYDGWCNYGNKWPSEEMRKEKLDERWMAISELNALGARIRVFQKHISERYIGDLTELPSRCNHEFEHLSLTGAHGENPVHEARVEYWASVCCLKCGTENLNLHARVA